MQNNNNKTKKVKKSEVKILRNRVFAKILGFTETIITWVTILYILNWFVSVGLILAAILSTGNFQYLDTLIVETSETFRQIVVTGVIKFGIENIFKYNDFGGRIPNKSYSSEDNLEFEEGGNENDEGCY